MFNKMVRKTLGVVFQAIGGAMCFGGFLSVAFGVYGLYVGADLIDGGHGGAIPMIVIGVPLAYGGCKLEKFGGNYFGKSNTS